MFNLLEGIYGAFDELVEQNKIFKVETIGDCYVAGKNFQILFIFSFLDEQN